ncbi:MAG TPA: TIGR03936 family radical SAM-associated protein [bacterium]|nr:TIGR03936 family radical SAM-associated protein [bacterium]
MTWYRIVFAKRPPLHWLSHLDLQTVWLYALRRSRLPLAFSEGFNPQPRLSILMPLELGITSEVEILHLRLTAPLAAATVQDTLAPQLPAGLAIHTVTALPEPRKPAIPADLAALTYRVVAAAITPAQAAAALAAHPAVSRVREGKTRVFALADDVLASRAESDAAGRLILTFTLRTRVTGALRAGEFVAAAGVTPGNIVEFTRTEMQFTDERQG